MPQDVGANGTLTAAGAAAAADPAADDPRGFVHLHLHSEYSLLDGGNRLDRLVDRVAELGMNAVAVTDHGNLFGAATFYETATARKVKPILGCEAYVAPGDRTDRQPTGVQDGGFHLVLLCENAAGWANLKLLASEAYLTGFYYKPRIDKALLERHNEGLIAILGHLGSELAHHLVEYEKSKDATHWARAVECCRWHAETFAPTEAGPRLFVELQHHIPEQNVINDHLVRIARELGLPLVCDNDSHFLKADEHDAHDTLICISTGKTKDDTARMRYPTELYVKSAEEMRAIFDPADGSAPGLPVYAEPWEGLFGPTTVGREACDNTLRIAARCDVELEYGNHAPVVEPVRPAQPVAYNGEPDRTAWFKRFCAGYEVKPFDPRTSAHSEEALKQQCDEVLRELCRAGVIWRYGPEVLDESNDDDYAADIRARLDRELKILCDKSISAYFLIVWDFVNWARQRGIPANARGSGVGTMTGYVLGLSNACPVKYGLLFERFTDPDRSEYPDIDIDLCQDGRGAVIDYVREKYGHVAQIITFGTLKARAAIRDVGRVFALPLPQVDAIAKLVPEHPKMNFAKALEQEPLLKAIYRGEADAEKQVFRDTPPARGAVQRLIDTGRVLEGQARHAGVHAAGVIVATRPLHEIVPLYKQSGAGETEIVTQWDGPTCERVGLLKMDFLGLRTLSVIERCKELIRQSLDRESIWRALYPDVDDRDPALPGRYRRVRDSMPDERTRAETDPLDLEQLAFNDDRVFELFRRGDTTGVFQFESGGMRRLLMEMKPDRLEDLIAANALYRPGPMDLIPDYNARKHGAQQAPKVHPIVDGFTDETYGIMVYQEQVMQIVHELGGIPLRAAYSLIKAISKKKESVIDAMRPKFVEGAGGQGLAAKDAQNLFELILKFAGYGFNKSHSTGYAIVAYQTALLKTYFPNQYMAAFLTYESQAQKVEDWIKYKDDCRKTRFVSGKVGVEIRPPDINLSRSDFAVVFEPDEPRDADHGHVRFGLKALKGAGAKAIDAIVRERDESGPYRSLHDFCERVPPGTVNKATIEALVCCGAFDSVHGGDKRSAMVATIDSAVSAGQQAAADRAAGQGALFGGEGESDAASASTPAAPEPVLARVPAWDDTEKLQREKETLGFYVSSHPLERWARKVGAFATCTIDGITQRRQDAGVVVGGLVKSVRPVLTRKNDRMAIVTLEDELHTMEAVLFPRTYNAFGEHLVIDQVVLLAGRVDHSRGDPQLIVERVVPIEQAEEQLAATFEIRINAAGLNGDAEHALMQLAGVVRSQRAFGNGGGGGNGAGGTGGSGQAAVPVTLHVQREGGTVTLESKSMRVKPSRNLVAIVERLLGEQTVTIRGGLPEDLAGPPKRRWQSGNGNGGGNGNGRAAAVG